MGCGGSTGSYPAEIPAAASLPAGIEVLDKNDKEAVQQAIDVCARSFAGSSKTEPAGEFDWLLSDVPDRNDETQLKERVHRLDAGLGFSVHYAFNLKARGLVLVAKPGAWEKSEAGDAGKAMGVVVLYFYPQKWSPSTDGMMAPMNAAMAAGASKWTKSQTGFVEGKRMKALDAALLSMHKKYATDAHIYVPLVAVAPECQGSGVGGKMMRAVNAIADALGLPLYLECDAGDKTPEGFYKKLGYESVGKEDITVKGGETYPGGMHAMRRAPAGK